MSDFGLYLNSETVEQMGDVLGQHFSGGELDCLHDCLNLAASIVWSEEVAALVDPNLSDDEAADVVHERETTRAFLLAFAEAVELGERRYS